MLYNIPSSYGDKIKHQAWIWYHVICVNINAIHESRQQFCVTTQLFCATVTVGTFPCIIVWYQSGELVEIYWTKNKNYNYNSRFLHKRGLRSQRYQVHYSRGDMTTEEDNWKKLHGKSIHSHTHTHKHTQTLHTGFSNNLAKGPVKCY